MGLEPSTQEAKKQVKAGMSWRQVLSGRVQHEYIKKKGLNVSLPGKQIAWAG